MMNVLQISRYTIAAVATVQLYDWLLLLGDEIAYIHRGRSTIASVCYLVCRYYPLVIWPFYIWAWCYDHRMRVCRHAFHAIYLCLIPFQMVPQAVILKRAHAFTGQRKIGALFFSASFVLLLALEIWAFVVQARVDTGPYRRLCGLKSYKEAGILSLAHSVVDLLSMAIVYIYFIIRRGNDIPLARSFINQGLGFFLLVFALNLMNATFWLIPGPGLAGVSFPMVLILSNVAACRLVLLLRQQVTPTESYQLRQCSQVVREALRAIDEPNAIDEPQT